MLGQAKVDGQEAKGARERQHDQRDADRAADDAILTETIGTALAGGRNKGRRLAPRGKLLKPAIIHREGHTVLSAHGHREAGRVPALVFITSLVPVTSIRLIGNRQHVAGARAPVWLYGWLCLRVVPIVILVFVGWVAQLARCAPAAGRVLIAPLPGCGGVTCFAAGGARRIAQQTTGAARRRRRRIGGLLPEGR